MPIRQLSTKQVVNLSSDPASGVPGEIYYNTSINSFKYYNGTLWGAISGGGGVFEVFYQPELPTSPQLGDIWVDSDESVPEYDALTINNLLPNQSENSNKFLQTNGTSTSWQNVNLSLYAPLLDPTFTGIPTAPTASPNTDTTQIATTAFVQAAATAAAASLIDSAPATLDTLNELAAALGDDANFATTISTALGGKEPTISTGTTSQYFRGDKSFQTLDKAAVGLGNVENTALSTWAGSSSITTVGTIGAGVWQGTAINSSYIDSAIARLASPTFTGTPAAPTASAGTSTTQVATTAFVTAADNLKAPLASPEFTGVVKTSGSFRIQSGDLINADISSSGSIKAESLEIYGNGIVVTGGHIVSPIATNARTSSYTLVFSDRSKLIEMNVSSANNLTIPPDSSGLFAVGDKIDIIQVGTGQTTIIPDSGVTMNSYEGANKLTGQWAAASLIKRGNNTWALVGNITS